MVLNAFRHLRFYHGAPSDCPCREAFGHPISRAASVSCSQRAFLGHLCLLHQPWFVRDIDLICLFVIGNRASSVVPLSGMRQRTAETKLSALSCPMVPRHRTILDPTCYTTSNVTVSISHPSAFPFFRTRVAHPAHKPMISRSSSGANSDVSSHCRRSSWRTVSRQRNRLYWILAPYPSR